MIELLMESFNSTDTMIVVGAFTFVASIIVSFLVMLVLFVIKIND